MCGCGVWAGTKRAHSRARRDTLTPGRELLAVCKQYLEVLATAQAGFLCRALCVSGAPSLRKDSRLKARSRESLSAAIEPPRESKISNKEGVSSFVWNRWAYEREPKNPHAIRFGAQREADLRHARPLGMVGCLYIITLSRHKLAHTVSELP